MRETVLPAFGAGLPDSKCYREPDDLRTAPLLHLASHPDAGERWFRAEDVAVEGVRGMPIDHFATAAQATISVLRNALLPKCLVGSELADGDLATIEDGGLESTER